LNEIMILELMPRGLWETQDIATHFHTLYKKPIHL